jgi:hypothetical protein
MTKNERAAQRAGERVNVRVLPQGAGRIFTGESEAAAGDPERRFPIYGRGEVFAVAQAIALELEGRGLVEIQP